MDNQTIFIAAPVFAGIWLLFYGLSRLWEHDKYRSDRRSREQSAFGALAAVFIVFLFVLIIKTIADGGVVV